VLLPNRKKRRATWTLSVPKAQHSTASAQLGGKKETWPKEKAGTDGQPIDAGKEVRDRVHVGADVGDRIMELPMPLSYP
jgi:hypothetical protein